MKTTVIFCFIFSLYIVYTHKNSLSGKIEEFPYINAILGGTIDFLSSFELENLVGKEQYQSNFGTKKINPHHMQKVLDVGFDFEEHKTLTEDGYILTTWRIPGRLNESSLERSQRKPVMLQHGLFDTSYTWLMLNATDCLPIKLAQNGYDVWMTNSRGNLFSLEHTNPEYDSNVFYSKFWDFTFHEMAVYDVTANIFYIKNTTGFEKINYIGHSQGTVQYFIQYTLNPTFIEENVDKFVALGTVVNVFNTTSKIVHILHHTFIMNFLEKIYVKNIFNMNSLMNNFVSFACSHLHFICKSVVQFFVEDFSTDRIDFKELFEHFYNLPGGTSARNVNHWVQFYTTKQFSQFDFGREINFLKYNQPYPPNYDITKFKSYSIKSLMTISNADPFSKWDDCQHLFEHLSSDVLKVINLENYNHLDYLWSRDASRDLNEKLLKESIEMEELIPSNESGYKYTPQGRANPSYRPPVFKKDFFDSLIRKENKQEERIIEESAAEPIVTQNVLQKLVGMFRKEVDLTANKERKVYLDGKRIPLVDSPNVVRNQRYKPLTIIPVVLFNQFKFFSNLFFLLIALSQFFPPLRVGFLFTYVAPLAVVLCITIIKEAVDDIKRYQRDKEANNQKFKKVNLNGFTELTSAEIQVGDIIQLEKDERVPADMVLLYSSDKAHSIFLRTDQLDGETDWKLRKPVGITQEIGNPHNFLTQDLHMVFDPPSKQIYYFKGVFVSSNLAKKEALSLEQTMWANTVLASSMAVGVVIYTGKETRAQKNSSEPQAKFGAIDMEINAISKALFFFMFVCAVSIVALSGFPGTITVNLINIFRFLLLLSSIIPISLRVNLDFAKIIYSYKISNDPNINGTIARNSTIPEELGRIQYLFTDKTGTLTQNEMVFKQICFESGVFTDESLDELASILEDECKKSNGPLKDVEENYNNLSEMNTKRRFRRNRNNVIRDAITALSLCHNVTPVEENGEKAYQASSPDEVALVKFAESLKLRLNERSQMRMQIVNADDKPEDYEILANFPFSSETKRMGILVKHLESGRLIFYLKGAEVVMEGKVQENSRAFLKETCESLASTGLRTLVISQKYVAPEEYEKWSRQYEMAKTEMEDRERKVQKVVDELEESMEFLCVTGVEDKLQVDVTDTIESLRTGGVQIWMLTGDKVETATCIAISTGLKAKNQKLFFMKEMKTATEVEMKLKEFEDLSDTILVIDGNTMHIALEPHLEKYFFEVAGKSPAVVCCRCSPTQKTLIVRGMKKYTNTQTCSIGDGGNDVGMIQEAHVGVGIVGKEGKQASLAADFSILEFRSLKLLLLWHGRLSYKRSAVLSQFVIHRGLIISIIQVIFSFLFYFTSIPIYNGYLMLGYATFYTSLPVFSIVFDEDVDLKTVIKFPNLYKILQKGRVLNSKTFQVWCFKSIYQGAVIMLGAVLLFEDNYLNIVSITFTSLIFIEVLNVYLEIHKLHIIMLFSFISTIGVYLVTMILLRTMFDVVYLFTYDVMSKIIIITTMSWLPFYLINTLYRKYFPEAHERL